MAKDRRQKLVKNIRPGRGGLYGLGAFFVVGPILVEIIPNGNASVILAIIAAVATAFLVEKLNARKRKYFSLVEKQCVLSIDSIASSCSVAYDRAYSDINKMIEKGFFGDAYIDDATQKVVIPNAYMNINIPISKKNVKCPTCGAMVTVYSNKENKCEYCGSSVEFN